MDRPFKEVTLPITGFTVGVHTYYLRGDRVAIQKIMTDAVEVTGKGEATKVDTGYTYDMDDEAVVRAIKFIRDGATNLPIEKKTIHALPEEDYDFLRGELPKEDKKKSTTRRSDDSSKKQTKKDESKTTKA